MQLGNFSVSLSVSDLAKSRDFYQILGSRFWGAILMKAGSSCETAGVPLDCFKA